MLHDLLLLYQGGKGAIVGKVAMSGGAHVSKHAVVHACRHERWRRRLEAEPGSSGTHLY